jgi:hypothetical protein
MRWLRLFENLLRDRRKASRAFQAQPKVELLEDRLVPYSVSGNAWPHPQLVTLSFVPDGTVLGSNGTSPITSNLFSAFNARFGSAARWQNEILRAAQTWAQQTNLNFAVVADNGALAGSGSYQQGDPGIGDIRIGGYTFGNSTLASAAMPPSINNYSIAGDIDFNTGQAFNIGTTYDLFTVALHEFGHALGLNHTSASAGAAMYPSYNGIKSFLTSDDIAGIRNIYSNNNPRSGDAYDGSPGPNNNSFVLASNLTPLINSTSLTAVVTGLDITTTADMDYYKITAPANTSTTVTVNLQSQGLSLLAPKLWVYAADQSTVLGFANGTGQYGTTLTLTIGNVTAGQQLYLKATGADTTVLGTGAYALTLNFGIGPSPTVPLQSTQTLNGNPISGGGGIPDGKANADDYLNSVPTITGISTDTGASSTDGVTNDTTLSIQGAAPTGNSVSLYRNGCLIGSVTALDNKWTFNYTGTQLADGTYSFTAMAKDALKNTSAPSAAFQVIVDTVAPAQPAIGGIISNTGVVGEGITNVQAPTLSGTAEANSTVTVYRNGQAVGTVAAGSSGAWNFPSQNLGDGSYAFTVTATDLAGNVSPVSAAYTVTLDTHAPSQPVVTGISPDSGIVGDAITNAQNLTVLGTAEPYSTVQVSLGSQPIGTAVTNGSGNWVFDYTGTTLAPGSYSFTATATDAAGNTSGLSHPFAVVITYTPPLPPVLTGISPDTGASSTDEVTSSQTFAVSGTAVANGTVNVSFNGTPVGSAAVAGDGRWSLTYAGPALADGSYAVTATATDPVGNTSAPSAALAVVVDTTAPVAPVVTGFSPDSGVVGDGITNAQAPTISGTAEPGSTVTLYRNGGRVATLTAGASGAWNYTSSNLGDGTYAFTATATDLAGNVSPVSAPLNITIDTHIGDVHFSGISPDTGLKNNDEVTNARNISLFGTADANTTVQLFQNGAAIGSTVTSSSGNWNFNYTGTSLADGTYNFTAQASDVAGNVSNLTNNFVVVVDNVATVAVLAGVTRTVDGSGVASLTLSGRAEPQSQVQVFLNGTAQATVNADGNGNWNYNYKPLTLPNGTYNFTTVDTDLAGNVSPLSANYKLVLGNGALDAAKPNLTSASILGKAGDGTPISVSTPTLTGTTKPGYLVTIVDGNTILGTVVANSKGQWTFVCPPLARGKHNVTVSITDTLGETGLLSKPLTFQI